MAAKKNSIIKNYLYNLSYQILLLIVPLITMPYLARTLGLGNQGTFSVLFSVVSCFVMLGCIGLNMYGQREIAYYKNDPEQCNRIFWEIALLRVITLGCSTVLYFGFIWLNCRVVSVVNVYEPLYFILFGLEILASMFDISWYYQGIEDFRLQTVRNFIVKLLGIVMIFLFVRAETDLWLYILVYSGMNVVGNASLWVYRLREGKPVAPRANKMGRHLKLSAIMFLPQIATTVYAYLDRLMLGSLINDGNVQVGVYDNAEKIVKIALTVVTSIGLVMLSRIANTYMERDTEKTVQYITNSFQLYLCLAVPIMFGVAGIAEVFVPRFFGDVEGFGQIANVMMMLSPIIFLIGGSNVFGTQYLLPTDRMVPYTVSVFTGMGVNVVFNAILIRPLGAFGAALSTVISELAVLIVQMIAVRKDFPVIRMYLRGWRNFVAGGVMFACVYALGKGMGDTIETLFVQITLGVIVYFVLLVLFRDPFIMQGANMVLSKFKRHSD